MARGDGPQDGRPEGSNYPGTVGKGQKIREPGLPPAGRCRDRARGFVYTEGLLAQVKAIADTGFLVAFGNRKDQYHAWARSLATRVTEPLLTCDAVLAETAFHLRSSALALAFVTEGLVRPVLTVADHLDRLSELAGRYADQEPDLADLCLIRLSELYPKHPVITTDLADFRVYRRGRREAIPLIHPPL